ATATHEMEAVVRRHQYVVEVLDRDGRPVGAAESIQLPASVRTTARPRAMANIRGADGREWRVSVREGSGSSQPYTVAVAAPLDELNEQWHTLLSACAIGLPLLILLAAGGGWWLGRAGLRPLTAMASEARDITAVTLERRLSIPDAGEELQQLAESFNHVLARLGTALSTQRRFMADASHELRTPVSIMRTAADVTLARSHREDAEYREALGVVAEQSARLARLVDDMLVLARADAGGYPLARADVDVGSLVRAAVRDLAGRADEKRIKVHVEAERASIIGDETLLRRLFENLLSNALKYTPNDGAVGVSVVRSNGHVLLRVSDTGPGIPPQECERIFERFVRLDPARESGGAGLGLAIARWVADAHDGTVRIASSGPGGTVFEAAFPTG
ncbi:MAG TPA: ATP-binding protein, partial [Vicinamibacterales bacterium]